MGSIIRWNQHSNGIMIAGLFAIFSKAFGKKGAGDGGVAVPRTKSEIAVFSAGRWYRLSLP
jgi:hypothetical protein